MIVKNQINKYRSSKYFVSQIKKAFIFSQPFFPPPHIAPPRFAELVYFPGCFALIHPLLSCPSKMGELGEENHIAIHPYLG